MSKQRYIWLLIAMFMVYTQGLWERLFSLPPGTTIMVELPLWIYFFFSIKTFSKPAPARRWFIFYIFFSFFAGIVNHSGIVLWAKYIRFFLYAYLLYLSLWNTPIRKKQWIILLKFAVFLIILQGLGSAFNIFILGQRIEGYVGLMSSLGGTTAAVFPLIVISSVATIYFFTYNQGIKFNWYIIILVISAALVGYSSGKRAIFFTIPLFLFFSIILSYFQLKGIANFYKKIFFFTLIIIINLPAYFYGIKTSRGLNYGLRGNENKIGVLIQAITYAKSYEEATSQYGNTIGRSGTTLQIINNSVNNISAFLFGYGYGSVKDINTQTSIGIGYGIVGFTRDIVSGGWILMFLTFIIISKIILTNYSLKFKFTKVLRIIVFSVFVFVHFGYSSDFTVSLKINFLMIFLLVFINSPVHSKYLSLIVNRNFYSSIK